MTCADVPGNYGMTFGGANSVSVLGPSCRMRSLLADFLLKTRPRGEVTAQTPCAASVQPIRSDLRLLLLLEKSV
ncbi:hypothetical protein AMECASPLE_002672 [Ameca splendens]|uniref:Uncharacterized protein n=1 Tax=Ameca splendens TaxID=208324 RepID=A0ABV0YKD6_9TELE